MVQFSLSYNKGGRASVLYNFTLLPFISLYIIMLPSYLMIDNLCGQ
jgi:hypothetical protein